MTLMMPVPPPPPPPPQDPAVPAPGDPGWPLEAYNGEYIADIASDFLSQKKDLNDLEAVRKFAVQYLRRHHPEQEPPEGPEHPQRREASRQREAGGQFGSRSRRTPSPPSGNDPHPSPGPGLSASTGPVPPGSSLPRIWLLMLRDLRNP